ncbi:MAG: acyl-CoA thioesterase [Phycisphaerae bacterium]|nr:acyl-CoA thioesterase [Phycisphaerae bacterium]
MEALQGKAPSESAVESRFLLMPHEANPYGTAFGGVIVSWMDMVAGMAAQRHCGTVAVTAGMDSIAFKAPIRVGDHVVVKACVNYVSRTSMEVGVKVIRENPYTGEQVIATSAHLTFVALDAQREPTPVPPLTPETAEEQRRFANARIRALHRKELLKKMRPE